MRTSRKRLTAGFLLGRWKLGAVFPDASHSYCSYAVLPFECVVFFFSILSFVNKILFNLSVYYLLYLLFNVIFIVIRFIDSVLSKSCFCIALYRIFNTFLNEIRIVYILIDCLK